MGVRPPGQLRKDPMSTAVTEQSFEDEVLKSDTPVIVDFWAEWCGPCRQFGPTFEKASEANEDIVFAKVDTEALPQVAGRFNIRSIPTLIRFDNGSESKRVSGAMRAEQLAQAFAL